MYAANNNPNTFVCFKVLLMLCSDLEDNEKDGEALENVLTKCMEELDFENKVCVF